MKKKVTRIFVMCNQSGDNYTVVIRRTGDRGKKKARGRTYEINKSHDVIDMLSSVSNRTYNPIVKTWIELSVFPTISMERI